MVQEGETHLLRIVSIDQNRQRIGLSLKAVTAMEQIEWMAQREIEKAAAEAAAEAAEAEAALAAAEAEEAMEEKIDSSATAQMESALRAKTGAVSKIEEEE